MSHIKRILDDIYGEQDRLFPVSNDEAIARSETVTQALVRGHLTGLEFEPEEERANVINRFWTAFKLSIKDDPSDRDRAFAFGRAVGRDVLRLTGDEAKDKERCRSFWDTYRQAVTEEEERQREEGCGCHSCDLCLPHY